MNIQKHTEAERDYQLPSHDNEKKNSKWARVRRRIGGVLLGLGAASAVGYGIDAATDAHKADKAAEVKMMNEKFEPILAPAAEDVARFVLNKAHQDENGNKKNHAVSYDVSGKRGIEFTTETNGVSYRVAVVVDKDAQGNPDPTKVNRAEVWETSKNTTSNRSGVVRKYDIEAPGANNDGYWGGTMTTDYPEEPSGLRSRSTYDHGGSNKSHDEDVEFAKTINERMHEQLRQIEKVS